MVGPRINQLLLPILCRPLFYLHASEIFLLGQLLGVLELMEALHAIFCTGIVIMTVIFADTNSQTHRSLMDNTWFKSWLKQLSQLLNLALGLLDRKTARPFIRRSYRGTKCSRYYVHGTKRRSSRVCTKTLRSKLQPIAYALAANKKASVNRISRNEGDQQKSFAPTYTIAIDNCASKCMTTSKDDFVSTPKSCNASVAGLGTSKARLTGTVKWTIAHDKGHNYSFLIHDVLYVPTLPFRVLSPQHWAQQLSRKGWCYTDAESVVLHWNKGENCRTTRLADNNSNIGLLTSSPDFHAYAAFVATNFDGFQENLGTCFPANVISDDEGSDNEPDA